MKSLINHLPFLNKPIKKIQTLMIVTKGTVGSFLMALEDINVLIALMSETSKRALENRQMIKELVENFQEVAEIFEQIQTELNREYESDRQMFDFLNINPSSSDDDLPN